MKGSDYVRFGKVTAWFTRPGCERKEVGGLPRNNTDVPNFTMSSNSFQDKGIVMTVRFLKFIDSEESEYLLENHTNAFLLLLLIAKRARRTIGSPDGLQIGEAHIGDYKKCGIETRDKYRHALKVLESRAHIKILETCRNRKKAPTVSPTGTTIIGTKVKILRSDIWDINYENSNHRNPHRNPHPTPTEPPPNPHEQECIDREIDKKIDTHPFPQNSESADADGVRVEKPPVIRKAKTIKPKKNVSQAARDLLPKFIDVIKRFKPTYVVKNEANILEALDEMLNEGRPEEEILRVLDWAVRDNTIRGNWEGWSSKVICKNPAAYLSNRFDQIDAASKSKTLRKFSPSSDDNEALKKIQSMKQYAL